VSDVVLFGIGDFAQVALEYLRRDSPHEVVAFTVHERYVEAPELLGLPVVPFEGLEETHPPSGFAMFVAVGFSRVNRTRRELYDECRNRGYELISYVSSKAIHLGDVDVGDNCFIGWSGNHIGHHAQIGDHCFIASHVVISGNVRIGEETFVGVNATFRDGVAVGPRNVVGAGALIMKDTEEGDVYSAPSAEARPMKSWDLKGF
jgi:acetyltransferase-like isoleucine patch superfamily enzyme